MPVRHSRELETASSAVREAADLCMAVVREMELTRAQKTDSSPVTVADYGSQALICDVLSRAFPDDPVVAEESSSELFSDGHAEVLAGILSHVQVFRPDAGLEQISRWIDAGSHDGSGSRYWCVDPVDGTKGFLRGDQFAIALALVEDGRPTVAAVACPRLELSGTRGILATAVRGRGARLQPLFGDGAERRLRVRDVVEPGAARFCESVEASHSSHRHSANVAATLGITAPPIRMDSQAKYAVVADGAADIYLRLPSGKRQVENVWDHAAGSLLVEEAGGIVTDCGGAVLDFGRGRRLDANRGVVATNGALHERVLEAFRTAG